MRTGKTGEHRKRQLAGLAAILISITLLAGGCAADGRMPQETARTGSAANPSLNRYQISSAELFDTVTVITGFAENERAFREKADRLIRGMKEYHQLCDIYQEYEGIANAKTINDRAGGEPVAVDQRLIALLRFAGEVCQGSGGKVDVTLGAMLRIWHQYREAGIAHPETAALPEAEALEKAMAHTGFDLLEINEEAGTVRLTDSEASLDLGALAKGYAVEQVCRELESGWLVNVGGNVYATGPKAPDGSDWVIGIQDPDGSGSDFIHTVRLEKGAVVTSGDYQRYYEADGKRYHHLIDPETRSPAVRWRAVTVLHPDSGIADALSTALFLTDAEEGAALLEKWGGEACWVAADGSVRFSDGYEARMR